jgi:hypothetical protein
MNRAWGHDRDRKPTEDLKTTDALIHGEAFLPHAGRGTVALPLRN